MSYKKAISVVNGQVIEECDLLDGFSPAVTIADDAVYSSGVTDLTGYATFVAGGDSCIIPFHKHNAGLVAGTKVGSADFSTTKDTASKINVYVESGELKIQNKSGASITLSVRF
jgi:hypothetical protein